MHSFGPFDVRASCQRSIQVCGIRSSRIIYIFGILLFLPLGLFVVFQATQDVFPSSVGDGVVGCLAIGMSTYSLIGLGVSFVPALPFNIALNRVQSFWANVFFLILCIPFAAPLILFWQEQNRA